MSAVYNGTAFLPMTPAMEGALILGIIWAVAGLNILGIRENARVTFFVFVVAAIGCSSQDSGMQPRDPQVGDARAATGTPATTRRARAESL